MNNSRNYEGEPVERELNPIEIFIVNVVSESKDYNERARNWEAVGDFFRGFPPALLLPLLAGVAVVALSH